MKRQDGSAQRFIRTVTCTRKIASLDRSLCNRTVNTLSSHNDDAMNTTVERCWAANCKNTPRQNPNVTFFKFPSDRTLLKQWCLNSGRTDLVDRDRSYFNRCRAVLCEEHFVESQFVPPEVRQYGGSAKQLLWNAIPTRFQIPFPEPNEVAGNLQQENVPKRRGRPPKSSQQAQKQDRASSDEDCPPKEAINVEDYEMSAIHTFPKERLLSIAKKQWQEIKRLRVHVKSLERTIADGITADSVYLLDILSRNLEGPLLDRVADIIVGDVEDADDEDDYGGVTDAQES